MSDRRRDDDPPTRPLLTERLRRLGAPVGVMLAAVMVVFLSYQGPLLGAVAAFVATVALIVWLRRRSSDGDGAYGPGAEDR